MRSYEERKEDKECADFAVSAVDTSPYASMKSLKEALAGLGPEETAEVLKGSGVDDTILSRVWLVSLIVNAEEVLFALANMLLLSVGLSGAIVKVSAGAVTLTDENAPQAWIYFWLLAFCNQLIGIFAIEELLMSRVHAFVFGGTDACVQMEERYLIDLYMGQLMQRIWESTPDHLSLSNKCALLFKLDDDDMQQLIVEEDYGQKSLITTSVHRHLCEHKLASFDSRLKENMGRWVARL